MANRRMLSKTIVQTQRFLRLPLETQATYCHMVVNADDDGVVEAFPIMRMINANEDSLNLLTVKNYLIPLNDEMVYFIKDFFEQNTIKADRYNQSKHRQLLLNALEKQQLLDKVNLGPRLGNFLEQSRLQLGTEMDPDGNHNIIKDKISQDKLDKDKLIQDKIGLNQDNSLSHEDWVWLLESIWKRELTNQEKTLLYQIQVKSSLLQLAIQKTENIESAKQNVSYLKGILSNWEARGLSEPEQVLQSEAEYEARTPKALEVSEDFLKALTLWKDE